MKLFGLHIPSFRRKPVPTTMSDSLLTASMQTRIANLAVLQSAYESGDPTKMTAALRNMPMTEDVAGLLFSAAFEGKDEIALCMLKHGVDPSLAAMFKGKYAQLEGALDLAQKRGSHELVSGLLAPLTQEQKDHLVVLGVRKGHVYSLLALLEAGADATQQIDGLPLIHIAPEQAEETKRLLRSVESGALLQSAMSAEQGPPHEPTKRPFTL